MTRRYRAELIAGLLVALLGVAVSGCPATVREKARIEYDATSVKNANDMTMMGSGDPGGIFVSYQQPVEFPLAIATTAYIQTKQTGGSSGESSSESSGDGGGGGWSRAPIEQGAVTILGESTCSKRTVDCNDDRCAVEISMDEPGYCVVSLSITAQSGIGASDCWGYGWVDGTDLSTEKRNEERQKLVDKRDELCG